MCSELQIKAGKQLIAINIYVKNINFLTWLLLLIVCDFNYLKISNLMKNFFDAANCFFFYRFGDSMRLNVLSSPNAIGIRRFSPPWFLSSLSRQRSINILISRYCGI